MKAFNVSIVVSTSDSAIAVAETLESIMAQTASNWEVIIVDDDSNPEVAAIVTTYSTKDSRIRLVNQSYPGICASRNAGIDQASFDWLLFMDAGDLLLPVYLERLTEQFAKNPQLDAIYCGWVRVTVDRQPYGLPQCCMASGDVFDLLAESNPFAIHGCMVRRSLVEAVGKFDPIYQIHEDWDLWQKIARTGAYFGGTNEVLALDRIEVHSKASQNQRSTILDSFTDAMAILARGHRADPRVLNPHPDHAQGKSVDRLPVAELGLICTYAGLAIGAGEDVRPILAQLREAYDLSTISMDLMKPFLYALPLPTCHPLGEYHALWARLEQPIDELALAFEKCFRLPAFARRARLNMERAILEQAVVSRPVTVGAIYAVQIELTQSIPDISAPPSTERLHCTVELEGERLGFLELPILDGIVASHVLADAIAAEFSEVILKRASQQQFHALDQSLNLEKANLETSSNTEDSERFQLPILMYHHVSPTGSSKFSRWRVTPEAFEAQLRCLREAEAYSITLEQWRTAILTQTPLPGRPVLITFDDGYLDFATYAFPLLKRYGFSATVFVVADFVGKTNRWDRIFDYGEELPLLNWEQIKKLHAEGIEFGSHTLNHYPLTSLSPFEIVREAAQSRARMEHELGIPITTFAYPYGDFDSVVQRLIGQCGYEVAVSCRPGYSHFRDPLLQLSRIEISGTDSIQDFERKLFPLLQGVTASAVPSGR